MMYPKISRGSQMQTTDRENHLPPTPLSRSAPSRNRAMLPPVFSLVFPAAQIQHRRVNWDILGGPSCLSVQQTFCLRTEFMLHAQYRGGHHAYATILWLSQPFHMSVMPQRLCSALPPRHTAHSDLLTIAGGDMTDVWQLLEVLPGLVKKV